MQTVVGETARDIEISIQNDKTSYHSIRKLVKKNIKLAPNFEYFTIMSNQYCCMDRKSGE